MAEEEVSPETLLAFAEEDDTGYAVLATMRAAAALGAEGDLEAARDLYTEVFEDRTLSVPLRDFARLRAAYLLFDNRPEAAADIAAGVESEAFSAHADELASAAALRGGDYLAAKTGFAALAELESAPQSVRARAATYAAVADAAANGTPLDAPENAGSFIERLGADLEAAGLPIGSSVTVPGAETLQLPEAQDPADLPSDEDAGDETPAEDEAAPTPTADQP
jgi:hypothetical protein